MHPVEKKKIEAFILSGFLGAGKTTLLKRILSWSADLSDAVVIVNEFGELGIDGLLLKNAQYDVLELSGGCICCALKTDLKHALKRIQSHYNPKRIFIETSGVADPAAIREVFQDIDLRPYMKVRKVITVLEVDFWEMREKLGSFFMSQLKEADLILLNKIDGDAHQGKISQLLEEIHEAMPHCSVIPTIHCNVDSESICAEDFHRGLANNQSLMNSDSDISEDCTKAHCHPHCRNGSDEGHLHTSDAEKLGFKAFSFQSSKSFNEKCFRQFTKELPWELFRIKGLARFPDHTGMLNYVGGKSAWTAWASPEETSLVFIGLKVNEKETIEKLKNCILRD